MIISNKHDNDCQQNFILLFMSLATAAVLNSCILGEVHFIFLKNTLDQT